LADTNGIDRFEHLFRTDLFGMALVNRRTGCVDDCNAKMAEFFGRSAEEIVGRHVAQFESFFPDHEDYQQLLVSWASGAPMHAMPVSALQADGTSRHGLVTIQSLPDSSDVGVVDVVLIVDVTAQHQHDAALRHTQRLDALGQLAGGIAHDFNNLLAVITGYAELLEDSVARSPQDRESVDEIKRAAGRAVRLIQGLLAFSRQAAFDTQAVDLNEVVLGSVAALQEVIGPQVEVQLRLLATRASVQTDSLQLEHLLLQLATNARDAMPDGGTLTLETSDEGTNVRLSVSDTGVGIEPATLERVFEPFFTTKELGAGIGLGLSTVYGIVTQSGGRVTAKSEPARGTSVEIVLPALDQDGRPTGRVVREGRSVVGTETILVVEEETALANLMESFLTRLGYRIIQAPNRTEALRQARARASRIDLAIVDERFSAAGGDRILDELRAIHPGLPAVVIWAARDQESTDLRQCGPQDVVVAKPFTMADLASQARTLIDAVNV
jgi:PAS domain S-box-containing protein